MARYLNKAALALVVCPEGQPFNSLSFIKLDDSAVCVGRSSLRRGKNVD